jgi:hypothetical protein
MWQRAGSCPRQRQRTCRSDANSSSWSECQQIYQLQQQQQHSPHHVYVYTVVLEFQLVHWMYAAVSNTTSSVWYAYTFSQTRLLVCECLMCTTPIACQALGLISISAANNCCHVCVWLPTGRGRRTASARGPSLHCSARSRPQSSPAK